MKKATWSPLASGSLNGCGGFRAVPSLPGVDTALTTALPPVGWARGSAPSLAPHAMAEPSHCSDLVTLFQLITDCVLVWNSGGTILEANPPCERLLGCGAEGLRGAAIADVVGDITSGRARLQSAHGDRHDCVIETRHLTHHAHGEITIAVIRPQQPSPGLSTVQGISRNVVERVTDVIFQIDIAGRWVFANQAWSTLTGWPMSDTMHHSFYRSIDEQDVPALKECMTELLIGRRQQARIAVRVKTAAGAATWVELALRTATLGRRIEGVAGTMTDITLKREFEEGLRTAAKRAESALTTKDMFLANMSHEIRTPMNAVIALTGLLLETSLNPEQRDFVETIRASGDTLLTLINEILDFSKVENDNFALEEAEFSIAEVVEGALDLVATSPKALHVELMLQIGEAVPKTMVGDACRLRQVLVNLAANALKFTAQGHVMVAVDTRIVGGVTMLRVEVSDTGIGIPAQRASQLFTPFTQVDASTTRQFGGTGLGLAICRKLISSMKGTIDFTSVEGQGTTFFFEVPLALSHVHQDASVRALTGVAARVVHPYGPGHAQISSILVQAGARLDDANVDVVVIDELAANLESLVCRPHQPTVLMVAKARRSVWHPVVAKAKLYGNNVVIVSKPVRTAQLVAAVGSWGTSAVAAAPFSESNSAISQPFDLAWMRVLVAEDNVVNQKVAVALLSKYGCKPDVVSNGVEALVALEQKSYDVVFLDVQMPEMDGLEAARRIVAKFPIATRPILISMTANVSPADRDDCARAGCELYVAKPVKVGELKTALQAAQLRLSQRHAAARPPAPNARLADLAQDVGDDLVLQIVVHFIDDAPLRIAKIENAVLSCDFMEISRAAHVLRSSALNIGLRDVAEACLLLEKSSSATTVDVLLAHLARIHSHLHIALDELQRFASAAA
ncbi:MAG: response regulator [Kofleriaceae bacterium]|nr:response regulator [Kofleriaceae bacterium]